MKPSRFTIRASEVMCQQIEEIKVLMRSLRPGTFPTTADAIRFALRQTSEQVDRPGVTSDSSTNPCHGTGIVRVLVDCNAN